MPLCRLLLVYAGCMFATRIPSEMLPAKVQRDRGLPCYSCLLLCLSSSFLPSFSNYFITFFFKPWTWASISMFSWPIILSQSWPSPWLIPLCSSFLSSLMRFCSFNIFSPIQCHFPASPFLTCALVFLAFRLSTVSLFPCTFSRALYLLCNDRTAGGKGAFLCCWKQQVSSLPSCGSLHSLLL